MLRGYRDQVDVEDSARRFVDEFYTPEGETRPGWESLSLSSWTADGLRRARSQVARLLEDDGVTYNPPRSPIDPDHPQAGAWSPGSGRLTNRWRLDPLPTVIAADEWALIEAGVAQRVQLLEAILEDLYGRRRLLTAGLVPPELVWQHGRYLRSAWGAHPPRRKRILIGATDLGRAADGAWKVISDRVQAPSGMGYAMENRRVISRLLPDAYRASDLRRLTPFFSQFRDTLTEAAPAGVEDPGIVVMTPGSASETAFDQAYIASLLGFPLVTGADLVATESGIRTRDNAGGRQVDVILRRVDDQWCDPLEMRGDSQLGVPGLLEAARRRSVVSANAFGAGLVESPAFAEYLPALCEALLDEPLKLGSAGSWWCGTKDGAAYVRDHVDSLIIRPVDAAMGGGVYGSRLSQGQRERWWARIEANPTAYVGQEILPLSTTPTAAPFGFEAKHLTLRAFATPVAGEASAQPSSAYAVMPGALGRLLPEEVNPVTGRPSRVGLSKDVWVLAADDAVVPQTVVLAPPSRAAAVVPMVPRALENLFWLGRYTERAESSIRHIRVLHALIDDYPATRAGRDPGRGAVELVAGALTTVTTTYPGMLGASELTDAAVAAEIASLLTDANRVGAPAQSLAKMSETAGTVRDQLSADVFTVLAALDRACSTLLDEDGQLGSGGAGVTRREIDEVGAAVLSGTLAMAGITSENMVRDVGWQLLDLGRGLERALQTLSLIRSLFLTVRSPVVERVLVSAALSIGESVVTHRRRYLGRQDVSSLVDLMVLDTGNPRSYAYQLDRMGRSIIELPGAARTAALVTSVSEAAADLRLQTAEGLTAPALIEGSPESLFLEHRPDLAALIERQAERLRLLSDAVESAYFWHQSAPRRLGSGLSFSTGVRA